MDDPNMHAYGEEGPDDAEIGRQWRENSSLEKWFPLTAERLLVLEAENEALKSDAERWRKALSAYERGVIMRSDGKDGYINVFLQAIHEREAAQAAGGRND